MFNSAKWKKMEEDMLDLRKKTHCFAINIAKMKDKESSQMKFFNEMLKQNSDCQSCMKKHYGDKDKEAHCESCKNFLMTSCRKMLEDCD